jgi:hypothetical protein
MVYVIAKNGKPLMPTKRFGKVRHLLKDGKAKCIHRDPFTIKLLYDSTEYTQDLTLGVDTGSGTLGAAVSDEEGNIVYRSKVRVRNDITEKMKQRAKYRKNRRNRKTRYRQPRFLNRGNSIKLNRLSPTIKSKIRSHQREIEFVYSILPITKLVLETGKFDMALMKNPTINRHWGYQKGINYGYINTHEYVLERDKYTCQICKGKSGDSKLEVHHIVFKREHGADTEDNLITLCKHCHDKLHKDYQYSKDVPYFKGKIKSNLKFASQMNVIRSQLLKIYPNAIETYGYITKANRLNTNLSKDHDYDACIIASAGNILEIKSKCYEKKCVADGDYQQTKGIRSEQKISTGKIQGLRKFDKVKYLGKEYFIKGRMRSGYVILMDINGNKIDFKDAPRGMKTAKIINCRRMQARKEVLIA